MKITEDQKKIREINEKMKKKIDDKYEDKEEFQLLIYKN